MECARQGEQLERAVEVATPHTLLTRPRSSPWCGPGHDWQVAASAKGEQEEGDMELADAKVGMTQPPMSATA